MPRRRVVSHILTSCVSLGVFFSEFWNVIGELHYHLTHSLLLLLVLYQQIQSRIIFTAEDVRTLVGNVRRVKVRVARFVSEGKRDNRRVNECIWLYDFTPGWTTVEAPDELLDRKSISDFVGGPAINVPVLMVFQLETSLFVCCFPVFWWISWFNIAFWKKISTSF